MYYEAANSALLFRLDPGFIKVSNPDLDPGFENLKTYNGKSPTFGWLDNLARPYIFSILDHTMFVEMFFSLIRCICGHTPVPDRTRVQCAINTSHSPQH